ncbi:SRPBCC domain-containing protein [Leptospira sarikeiensis]|uniref:ATPase n=1 Tax=Leptospira sarikeiensis TaxID=2484943 RepID=A0A4R9JXC3_9LEPT|nr:SRPBCC domain-containing protein [Leptospira sarikeiensis]TGL57693.1 ATPase [Leptospira sarikeiensis]
MERLKVAHEIFSIEKVYEASAEEVFSAWSSLEARAQWFIGPSGWEVVERKLDFKVGGKEILHGRFENGRETLYRAEFYNIIPNERIVFVYDMHVHKTLHSVSIASVELESVDPKNTRLKFTEQVAFLDDTVGSAGVASRKEGTSVILDRLTIFLESK